MLKARKYLAIFLSAILSGFCITFGATVYLMCLSFGRGTGNVGLYKIIGSFMFGIGLFTIIHFKLWLYTGKVGYVFDNKADYLIDVLICFIGNVVGSMFLSFLISLTKYNDILYKEAYDIANAKMNDSFYSIYILAVLCGVMIYLAVEGHKRCSYPLGKVIFAFMPISLFILAGFEHVVANVTYFTYAHVFSWKALLYFFLMFIGNGIGSICFNALLNWIDKLKNEKKEEVSKSN